ncbi:hypothetical protein FRC02_012348 [Tulasnella sp. 418]|nr:hypothetical protein FRC02_012348 [Tulasnella sp. 418]
MHALFTFGLLASLVTALPSLKSRGEESDIWGYGADTMGGANAPKKSIFTVKNYNQLKTALSNYGSPDSPKIIYLDGVISGNTLPDGTPATEDYYARDTSYKWDLYLQSFNETYKAQLAASSNPADQEKLQILNEQADGRYVASVEQKKQVTLKVGANTTIKPAKTAKVARIEDIALAVNWTSNVILQGFQMYTPIDLFPEWDPTDGSTGNWNSGFDAIGIVTSTNIWLDHLTISDDNHPDSAEPTIFGKKLQRHDGAIDITEGSDLITISYNHIYNHDKTHLVGNNDLNNLGPGDIGKLRVTFYGNHWVNTKERSPRLRFGTNHIFNNYYQGTLAAPNTLVYYLGMGINSTIISEANVFEIDTASLTSNAAANYVVGQYKGHVLSDNKSLVNGGYPDLEAVAKTKFDTAKTAEVNAAAAAGRPVAEWATYQFTDKVPKFPRGYDYELKKASDVKKWVLKNAGHANYEWCD